MSAHAEDLRDRAEHEQRHQPGSACLELAQCRDSFSQSAALRAEVGCRAGVCPAAQNIQVLDWSGCISCQTCRSGNALRTGERHSVVAQHHIHLCVSRILQGSLHVQDQDVVIVGKHDSCRSKDALWAVLIEDYVTQRKLLLSKDQVQRLLQARSSMMEGLQAAQQSRQSAYASLNHASQVCNCHEWPLHACPGRLIEACALWSFELYVVPYMKLLKVVVERLLGQ